MRISSILLFVVPVVLAAELEQTSSVVSTPSTNIAPFASSLELPTPLAIEDVLEQQDGRIFQVEMNSKVGLDDTAVLAVDDDTDDTAPESILDPWPEPARESIELGTLETTPGSTKSLRARSEGTLGQTPWIGMAIGLTCTALAAVMLG